MVYRDRYRPLLAEMPPRPEAPARPFLAVGRRATKTDAAPERPSEEIQIHIGRIEVVAVPPAPARTETRPSHKSPNLSDYLKLRHGRL